MMKTICGFVACAALLSGCATVAPHGRAAFAQQMAATTPTCSGARQCEAAWTAAHNWVADNCVTPIRTSTDTIIRTSYTPGFVSTNTFCRVIKIPRLNGGSELHITLFCKVSANCVPNVKAGELAFNRSVSAAAAQFASHAK